MGKKDRAARRPGDVQKVEQLFKQKVVLRVGPKAQGNGFKRTWERKGS
jgi:hypothetical protein